MTQQVANISFTAFSQDRTVVLGEPVAVQGVRTLGAINAPAGPDLSWICGVAR